MSWNQPISHCQGKVACATKGDAIATLDRIRKRGRRRHGHKDKGRSAATVSPYRCTSCDQWHLGNPNEGKPRK